MRFWNETHAAEGFPMCISRFPGKSQPTGLEIADSLFTKGRLDAVLISEKC